MSFWQNVLSEALGGIISGIIIGVIFTIVIEKMLKNQDKQGIGSKLLRDIKNLIKEYIGKILVIPMHHGIPNVRGISIHIENRHLAEELEKFKEHMLKGVFNVDTDTYDKIRQTVNIVDNAVRSQYAINADQFFKIYLPEIQRLYNIIQNEKIEMTQEKTCIICLENPVENGFVCDECYNNFEAKITAFYTNGKYSEEGAKELINNIKKAAFTISNKQFESLYKIFMVKYHQTGSSVGFVYTNIGIILQNAIIMLEDLQARRDPDKSIYG